MPPVSSSQHSVYCACPGPIRPRSLVSVALTYAAAPDPPTTRLAQVADVEDPDALPDRGVLLDHARGVLHRHRPAPELGELRAERHVPIVQRRAQQIAVVGHGRKPTAATSLSFAGDDLHPAHRQPREDPGRRGRRGAPLRGRRTDRGAGWGAGRQGLRTEVRSAARGARREGQAGRGRQGADGRRHLLTPAGAGRPRRRRDHDRRTPRGGGRRADRDQRGLGRARPARRLPRPGARGDRGPPARRLHVHDVQERVHAQGPGRRRGARPDRATQGHDRGLRGGAGARPGGGHHPRLGEHPAGRPDSAGLRGRGRRGGQAVRAGQGQDQGHGPGRAKARRARLRRAARRRRRLGRSPAAGRAELRAPRCPPAPRPGRQGHHLRLRRAHHQALEQHDRDEVGHGRARRRWCRPCS